MPKPRKTFSEALKDVIANNPVDLPEHNMLYVPILKGKAGELSALKELSNDAKSKILPVIEIPEVPWDFVNERYAKTTSNHVKGFIKKFVECYGVSYPVIIDASSLDHDMGDGEIVIDHILTSLHERGIEAIPVIQLSDRDIYLDSVKPHFKDVRRACLRITFDDINDRDLEADIDELLGKVDLGYGDIDLLIDFKDLAADQEKIYSNVAKASINNSIPNILDYNSLSIAMTSFPENLSGHGADTMVEIPRAEWAVWKSILSSPKLKRKPIYGDYGISSSEMQSIDPRIMVMSANIRYTHEETWVIVKGRNVKKHTFEQFYDLSEKIVDSDFFYGEDFSWGDKTIKEKADKKGGTGNATTWREVGTNHHITVVVNQVSAM